MGLVFTTSEFVIISQGKGRDQGKSGSFFALFNQKKNKNTPQQE